MDCTGQGPGEPGAPAESGGGTKEMRSKAGVWVAGFFMAASFLTVLRAPAASSRATGDRPGAAAMVAALPWFPVVGALIGGGLVGVDWLCGFILPAAIRSVVLLGSLALVTGCLHLDGFIDCCDGLFNGHSVERRLEIMRDSRVGAYGVVGGVLLLLGQFTALTSLTGPTRVLGLIAAPLLGRWSMVYAVVCFPYRRDSGVGSAFRGSARHLAGASAAGSVFLLAASIILLGGVVRGSILFLVLVLLGFSGSAAWSTWASHRLGGGLTGDTYGALNEIVTLVVLVALPILFPLCARL